MKNVVYLLLALFIVSCEKESIPIEKVKIKETFRSGISSKKHETIVIRFTEGVSESEKNALRVEYGVINYKACSCGDKNLESWDLDEFYNEATIEERVTSMKEEPEMEGADYDFEINISSNVPSGVVTGNVHIQDVLLKTKQEKSEIVIGVLDTGVDPSYFGFQYPFLHNSAIDNYSCSSEFFGWNFIDETNMPVDDNGHGTIVTSLIVDQLDNSGTNFDVIPAKAFGPNGNGSLFNISCATSYLILKKVNIINMSFGWEGASSYIMESYIKEASQKNILIVTSAGNTGSNNDVFPHYPSSYISNNILVVTAVDNNTPPNLILSSPSISNYGKTSVDIAVWGVGVPFYPAIGETPISITGSSYSCAKVTGYAGRLYHSDMSLSVLYHKVLDERILANTLQYIKYKSYLDL